ncbi:chemotaxis protein CheR [Chelatococcus sambhunathii]|uniref:protein-glutamate O-methyltransferase n=1 Tax=Chelatococcus sambhunathii TaxID=363953 RepID=A0ABU1DCM7_9HYPH|nr:CheR family methyltransferase [Chelatococcus sambhunathii]MDR4305794.1 chemotaxis protein CheR [Chelatococcus sambhunathii]
MTPAQFAFLTEFLKQRSGIAIGEDKRYLVEARLAPLARMRGLASLGDLIEGVRKGLDVDLGDAVIEAMTTNETFFFRDGSPFQALSEVMLPKLIAARSAERRLRIWSAACSTGQEPYSIAMTLDQHAAALAGWTIEIVATDLSAEVIAKAKAGLFTQFEVQRGLPIRVMLANFTQDGDKWRISEALRRRVHFRTLNLLRDFSALGRFDVVFCRNVLIYFDVATKRDVLARTARQTAEDGYLVLGAAESLASLGVPYLPVPARPGLFARVPSAANAPSRFGAAVA